MFVFSLLEFLIHVGFDFLAESQHLVLLLLDEFGLSSDDLFLALHIILQDSAAYLHASAAAYTAPAARSQLERGVDLCANRLLASDRVLRSRLSEARARLQDNDAATALKAAYGPETWARIHEKGSIAQQYIPVA